MSNTIPFYKHLITDKHRQYIDEVLTLQNDSKIEKLENRFRDYIGSKCALSTNSSTSALHLAMCALDLKRGDKIICSINSFPDLPEVVRHFDAEPLFVDCKEDDYTMDINKLESVIIKNKSKKLRAVIINHIAGRVGDLESIYRLAKEHNIKIVEDASDAMGAEYQGTKIGNTGADITTYSFSPHLHNSVIQGGMLVTNDENLYNRAKLFRTHAIRNEEGASFDEVEYLYNVIDIGWKYDMSELSAAACLAEFENLDASIKRREEIAQYYLKQLSKVKHITLPTKNSNDIFGHFVIEIDTNRDAFARELKKAGVMVGLHYIPLHFMDYYKNKYELKVFDFPKALGIYQKVMSLPIYNGLTNQEVDAICSAIKKVAKVHI